MRAGIAGRRSPTAAPSRAADGLPGPRFAPERPRSAGSARRAARGRRSRCARRPQRAAQRLAPSRRPRVVDAKRGVGHRRGSLVSEERSLSSSSLKIINLSYDPNRYVSTEPGEVQIAWFDDLGLPLGRPGGSSGRLHSRPAA